MLNKIKKTPFSWLSLQEIVTFSVNYGLVLVFAKLLAPESFGVVALLNIYTGFFSIIASLGLGKMIVSKQIKNNTKLSALLTGSLVVALAFFLLALILLPLYIYAYFDDFLINFFYGFITLFSIILGTLYTFAIAIYIRDKKFIKLAKLSILSFVISFFLVVILATLYPKTISLILKQLIVAIIPISILFIFSDFRYKIVFSKIVIKDFFSFSKFIALDNLFNYFVRNLDYLILGNFFDKSIVGQYSLAYKILLTPVKMLVKQIDKVSFPILVQLKNNSKIFRKYYLSNIALISQLLFPIIISIIIFSNDLVKIFFDKRYQMLPMMIAILSISALFQSITALVGNVFIINNQTKLMFKLTVFKSVILFVFLLTSAYTYNIYYFIITYVLTYILTNFTLSNYFALKPYKISLIDIINIMIKPILFSIIILNALKLLFISIGINVYLKLVLIILTTLILILILSEKIKNLIYK